MQGNVWERRYDLGVGEYVISLCSLLRKHSSFLFFVQETVR